jgi:hypothetical protein
VYVFVPDRELDFLTDGHVKLDTDCIDTDCIDADCITKDCINAKFETCKLYVHRTYNTNLYCSNSYDMNSDRVTDSHVKLNILDDMQECLNKSHHRIALEYDEDTVSLVVDPTLSTSDISTSVNSDSSTGNASTFKYECYEVKDDKPQFNYHGTKIKIPKQESPVTICTADTIGAIKSWRLFWVLFDSGSNVSMIKRSALPKGVFTKLLGDTKLVRTLVGRLKMQEVVTMQDIRLPEFDKNRRINQQKVLVFDNDNVKYNIILGTNFHSKTEMKLNYSEGNMEWFDCSIPLCPPGLSVAAIRRGENDETQGTTTCFIWLNRRWKLVSSLQIVSCEKNLLIYVCPKEKSPN